MSSNAFFHQLITNGEDNTEEEEKSLYFFNNLNNSNNYSIEDYNLIPSEINDLYFLDKSVKEIIIDSPNLIKSDVTKLIKFKTETNPPKELLNKKTKNPNSKKEEKKPEHSKKPKKSNKKKPHTAEDDDNILRKIQVMFLSFIISFANDIVTSLSDDKDVPLFKDLDYKIKKIVNHKFVEDLKATKLENIVKLKITPKVKQKENINEQIYKSVLERFPDIQEFFDRTYLNLFEDYYENKNNIFKFNEKVIPLSYKTKQKTFAKLIEKNIKYKEKIKIVTINYYLNSYKRIKKPNFKTRFCKKSNQNIKIE